MSVIEWSVLPIGKETPGFSKYIARAIELLEGKHLKYELTATCTIIEGDTQEILAAIYSIHNELLKENERVITNIKIDERSDRILTIEGKVQSVKNRLQNK